MTALAKDRETLSKDGQLRGYKVKANNTIYKGALVALGDDGYAIPATDTANLRIVGVAHEKVISPATDADGDKMIRVQSGKSFHFNATSITIAMLGDVMFVVDDNTVDETVTNGVPVGRLVEFIDTTHGYVYIPEGGCRKAGVADATYSANETAILNDTIT